ncbi:class I SAM-dependent methyltransferase [Bacillus sp. FJAT-27245]|uniref:class I SAM-dependent methyltransferase n=1 Tax=Bacillus sp. FJAT-27245 TaxID=1684144 RepID=UPI0006A7B9E3|nr:class I SAM-dependent methyltransferase [Bacillus sp. FJAT-27245]
MNSNWNKIIYKFWPPVYDVFFNKGPFLKARKELFSSIPFLKSERILFVGVGTGADLMQIPLSDLNVTAIDFSKEMLEKAKRKANGKKVEFLVMDAQELSFPDESFDWVIGSLILSVVPDGEKAFQEMARVVKKGGGIVIFDKFAPRGRDLGRLKKLVRPLIRLLGTDIGISFEKVISSSENRVKIKEDRGILLGGMYRKIVLERTDGGKI